MGAMCAVALPLIIVSAAKWEKWVRALSSPPASKQEQTARDQKTWPQVSRITVKQTRSKPTPHIPQIICLAFFHFVYGAQGGLCPTDEVICVQQTGLSFKSQKKPEQKFNPLIHLNGI